MTFTHTTGTYNVEASMVAWLAGQLTTNKPDTVSAMRLNLDYPEQPLNPPEWSITFLNVDDEGGKYHGGNVNGGQHGSMMFGLAEVGCWVTRADTNWRQIKAQMCDAVTKSLNNLYATGGAIIIKDFYTSATAPADTSYRITIRGWALRPPPTDPNPAIERERVLIYFQWVERV